MVLVDALSGNNQVFRVTTERPVEGTPLFSIFYIRQQSSRFHVTTAGSVEACPPFPFFRWVNKMRACPQTACDIHKKIHRVKLCNLSKKWFWLGGVNVFGASAYFWGVDRTLKHWGDIHNKKKQPNKTTQHNSLFYCISVPSRTLEAIMKICLKALRNIVFDSMFVPSMTHEANRQRLSPAADNTDLQHFRAKHGFERHSMEWNGIEWNFTEFNGIQWNWMEFDGTQKHKIKRASNV